ncbi:putative remorin [Dioscorea sansibarensis]
MLHNQQRTTREEEEHHQQEEEDGDDAGEVREIHALTPSPQQPAAGPARGTHSWETTSHRSSTLSEILSENFTTMSREFNAMVLAGSGLQPDTAGDGTSLARIGEEVEETNPLAIVPDRNPIASPRRVGGGGSGAAAEGGVGGSGVVGEVAVHRVKKEEVEAKIMAWQTAEIAKINNRFKRQDVVINGWESDQVEKATSLFNKVERKLDEQRARAREKMQNDVAKARRKAEEKRASSEAKRGTKVARVLELANLMKAVGRAPSKRSFF